MEKVSDRDRFYMSLALEEAREAAKRDEVPVGAVVVLRGEVISRAHNRREELQSPVAHAEILALEEASRRLRSWRLNGCALYVTLEPCVMCAGAVLQARISRLVFGCLDPRAGAVESLYRICGDARLAPLPELTRAVLEKECAEVLDDFFARLRGKDG